jgi:hypothetical protein
MDAPWRDLVTFAPTIYPPSIPQTQTVDVIALPLLQQAPTKIKLIVHAQRHEQLMNMLQSPHDQARLHSIACRTSGAFPDTVPYLQAIVPLSQRTH